MDPTELIDGLVRDDDGAWRPAAGEPAGEVAYPAEGHGFLAEVEAGSFWVRARSAAIVELVRRHSPAGAILDLGGGNGVVSEALLAAGFDAILVEPGDEGVRNGLRRGLPAVVQASLQALSLRPGAAAAVGLFDVIEHLPDDAGALARLARGLRPGGRIYLTAPAFSWLWSSHDVHLGHQRRYTRAGLVRLVEGAGFDVDQASYLFAPLVAPVLALRTLPSAVGLRRRWPRMQRVEHSGAGLAGLLEPLFAQERRRLAAGKAIPWGTSVILAARRR